MILYRILIAPLLIFGFLIGRVFSKKIAEGFRLRQKGFIPLSPSPIWIHAASGEFEYAKPVIRELKSRFPNQKILVTFFSPTYAKNIEKFEGVDLSLALPFDLPGPMNNFLKFYNPKLCLIARTDLWPEMLTQTHAFKIPIILFSATQAQSPSKIKNYLLNKIDFIFCVDDQDAQMLCLNQKVKIIGDTRYDQALFRLQHPNKIKELRGPRPLFIAGSTWPEDEKRVLESFPFEHYTLVLVPHEPSTDHIESIKKLSNVLPVLYSELNGQTDCPFILVDQIGILAELYLQGDLAFVGGSFKKTVHSVMEPLAAGLSVAVGPYYKNNREAIEFEKLDHVRVIYNSQDLGHWIFEEHKTKESLKSIVEQKTGASKILVDELIARYPESLR